MQKKEINPDSKIPFTKELENIFRLNRNWSRTQSQDAESSWLRIGLIASRASRFRGWKVSWKLYSALVARLGAFFIFVNVPGHEISKEEKRKRKKKETNPQRSCKPRSKARANSLMTGFIANEFVNERHR